MFSNKEKKAIEEKLKQLKMVKSKKLSHRELADLISQRRLEWIEKNSPKLFYKYRNLSPEEQAYKIIFLDHMKINPRHSEMIRLTPKKIKIKSYNFCPYLEACNQLDLKTEFVCRHIGEPSIRKMINKIYTKLKFSRNYNKIRPNNDKFCEEYIELTE